MAFETREEAVEAEHRQLRREVEELMSERLVGTVRQKVVPLSNEEMVSRFRGNA